MDGAYEVGVCSGLVLAGLFLAPGLDTTSQTAQPATELLTKNQETH